MRMPDKRDALDRSPLERGGAQPVRQAQGLEPAERRRGVFARKPRGAIHAFSLIEVIAAVAIFAIGMVAVLGLFAPVTKSVAGVSEAESAARVSDALRARLQAL